MIKQAGKLLFSLLIIQCTNFTYTDVFLRNVCGYNFVLGMEFID